MNSSFTRRAPAAVLGSIALMLAACSAPPAAAPTTAPAPAAKPTEAPKPAAPTTAPAAAATTAPAAAAKPAAAAAGGTVSCAEHATQGAGGAAIKIGSDGSLTGAT